MWRVVTDADAENRAVYARRNPRQLTPNFRGKAGARGVPGAVGACFGGLSGRPARDSGMDRSVLRPGAFPTWLPPGPGVACGAALTCALSGVCGAPDSSVKCGM